MDIKQLKERAKLAWAILTERDGNIESHAVTEFRALGYYNGDEMNAAMATATINLLRTFSTEGHSGFSASHCRQLFAKLADFKPLGPLTGDDSEWIDHGGTLQNRRCGTVFKEDGIAYNIDGVVFKEPNGCCFTGKYSRVPVTFPYTPKTVYAKVDEDATDEQKQVAAQLALAAG